jgi:ABC-type antimicrobial peptide transport system permease subunit
MINEKELLYSYADVLTISMPKPRTQKYEAHIEIVRGVANTYFSAIEEALGFFPVELKSPLLEDLADYSRYVMFVAIIFDLVAILLVIISVLLIYSLLVINVETKTFDIGVQRMVGLTRRGLILMVLIQGVLFVVPALVSAFLVSIPVLMAFQ